MQNFIPDHFKTEKSFKKLPFVIRDVPDQYNMCDKAILENSGTLSVFLSNIKIKKCEIKLFIVMFMH